MSTYSDYSKLILPRNFTGKADGTSAIFGSPVSQSDGKYNITYTYFRSSTDIQNAGYYWPYHFLPFHQNVTLINRGV